MKNTTKTTILILILGIVTISACKKEDNSPASSSVSSIITSGSWRVSYYHESGNDRTSNFSGYTFTFNSNETMTAANSSGTTNGTWKNDDSNANEFHMSMGSASPCNVLNHGWLIISKTSSEIDMKDDNSAHDEEMHFTKI